MNTYYMNGGYGAPKADFLYQSDGAGPRNASGPRSSAPQPLWPYNPGQDADSMPSAPPLPPTPAPQPKQAFSNDKKKDKVQKEGKKKAEPKNSAPVKAQKKKRCFLCCCSTLPNVDEPPEEAAVPMPKQLLGLPLPSGSAAATSEGLQPSAVQQLGGSEPPQAQWPQLQWYDPADDPHRAVYAPRMLATAEDFLRTMAPAPAGPPEPAPGPTASSRFPSVPAPGLVPSYVYSIQLAQRPELGLISSSYYSEPAPTLHVLPSFNARQGLPPRAPMPVPGSAGAPSFYTRVAPTPMRYEAPSAPAGPVHHLPSARRESVNPWRMNSAPAAPQSQPIDPLQDLSRYVL